MGALHKAHLELIRIARQHAGKHGEVAVSIFVNPLQFEPGSDYEHYPRPEKDDEEFCRNAGVDLLFRPTGEEMYANDRSVFRGGSFAVESARGQIRGRDIFAGFARWWRNFLIFLCRTRRCLGKKIFSSSPSFAEWCAT